VHNIVVAELTWLGRMVNRVIMSTSSLPPKSPTPPTESPKTLGIGCLVVLATFIIVGGIMHMSDAPVPPQPVTNSAPVTTQEQSASYNDLKAPNRPNVVATIKPAEHSSTNAPKDAVVAQIERDYAKAHAQLIRRFSEGERRQIAVELAQAEDKAQVEAEQRYSPEDVMGEST